MMSQQNRFHFEALLPETIFKTVTVQGFRPNGYLTPLNSYENRVYEIGLEDSAPIVAKYYRPGRWSLKAIGEEHRFLSALGEVEIPVVSPIPLPNQVAEVETIARTGDIFYAFFPKFRGREHDEILNDDRRWLGRTLGRLHNIGEHFKTRHRMVLNPETYGENSLDFILTQTFLPADLKKNIEVHLLKALELIRPFFAEEVGAITVHGDCHPGNILWNRDGPCLVDFDDMVMAPPVQDLWMLFNGNQEEMKEQRRVFFEGYEMFRNFDEASLLLTEPLRTLRMIRYAAWIGQRYAEEAFRRAFPYYQERRYWEEFLLGMKEQISLLQEVNG